MIIMMRTTLNLPDDVLSIAKDLAASKRISLGDAVGELVRRGMSARVPYRLVDGIPVIDTPPGTPPLTLEQTLEAQEDW